MKKIICIVMLLFFVTANYAQNLNDNDRRILIDNGGLYDLGTRYVLQGSKWNKTSLTYYINNTSSSLTAPQRESIIQMAFQRWTEVTNLSFTQKYIQLGAFSEAATNEAL